MKKINVIIVFILILSLLLAGCSDKYTDWQSVSVSGVGTFKVPQEWVVTHKENILYVTDRSVDEADYKVYLIGYEGDGSKTISPHELFADVKYVRNAGGTNYSNSAAYFLQEYDIGGDIAKKYIVHLYSSNKTINLIAWDELIDEPTIIKITQSYVSE